ncbi:MAG: DUF3431 domain-containing protein [Desulfovibrio sp.]|nr:MAG: DUF3431 domain-containing protein [Desulfovibrio sp.]
MSIQAVIAKYREDVAWTEGFHEFGITALVYDKSGDPEAQHPLPNIGREAHTYLHHIVSQYEQGLADFTLFLQGKCLDHMEPGMTAQRLARRILDLANKKVPFKGLADYSIRCDGLGRPHGLSDPANLGKWRGWGKDIPVAQVYSALFSGPVPESFHIRAPAGLLFVSRERIQLRPLGLYQRALDLVEADPDDANNTGHALERLWYLIFNGYAKLNKESYE